MEPQLPLSRAFESLATIKARDKRYFWMSKNLRECVELFGHYDGYYGEYVNYGVVFTTMEKVEAVVPYGITLKVTDNPGKLPVTLGL